MGIGKKITRTLAAGLVAATLAYGCGTQKVDVGSQGIRQQTTNFGMSFLGETGYQCEVLGPGRHYRIPLVHKIHELPADVQVLEMLTTTAEAAAAIDRETRYTSVVPAARIETSDGFNVHVDASIMYTITDPCQTLKEHGQRNLYLVDGIIPRAEPALKAVFGQLGPEEFFEIRDGVPIRRSMQEPAKYDLNQRLEDSGIEVSDVRIRYPHFHPQIQARFENRKIEDQRALTAEAETRMEEANATLQGLIREGEQAVTVLEATGQAYSAEKEGERLAYVASVGSEADRVLEVARADATANVNNAYRGEGSDLLVALEMAPVIDGLPFILWQEGSSNPMELSNLIRLFSAGGGR